MNILVIDDNFSIRIFLKKALSLGNHTVTTCENGLQAFALLSQTDPPSFDICLVDIMMPEMDGIKFLRELSKLSYQTKVCMLTSLSGEDSLKACMDLGVDDYIVKPIDKDTILDKVNLIVNGSTLNPYAKVNSKILGNIEDVDIVISEFSEFEVSFVSFEEFNNSLTIESEYLEDILGKKPYVVIQEKEKIKNLYKHRCIWSGLTEKDKIMLRRESMTKKDLGYEEEDES